MGGGGGGGSNVHVLIREREREREPRAGRSGDPNLKCFLFIYPLNVSDPAGLRSNRDLRVQGEEGGREVGGRGRAGQTEAAEEPHQLHLGAAQRAGAALRRDALPRRVHAGGAEPAARPVRGPRAGEGRLLPALPLPRPLRSRLVRRTHNAQCSALIYARHAAAGPGSVSVGRRGRCPWSRPYGDVAPLWRQLSAGRCCVGGLCSGGCVMDRIS